MMLVEHAWVLLPISCVFHLSGGRVYCKLSSRDTNGTTDAPPGLSDNSYSDTETNKCEERKSV